MALVLVTATDIIPAMKLAMQADAWLGVKANVPTIVCGHSGTFDADTLPKPSVVFAPETERNPYPPVSRNAQKLIRITIHAYTMYFGTETGMVGDARSVGVMPLIDILELLFDDNLLSGHMGEREGWIVRAHALDKVYPGPLDMNYGLNEARLTVEYLTVNPALA